MNTHIVRHSRHRLFNRGNFRHNWILKRWQTRLIINGDQSSRQLPLFHRWLNGQTILVKCNLCKTYLKCLLLHSVPSTRWCYLRSRALMHCSTSMQNITLRLLVAEHFCKFIYVLSFTLGLKLSISVVLCGAWFVHWWHQLCKWLIFLILQCWRLLLFINSGLCLILL